MNREERLDRLMEGWMAVGPMELPDRTVAAIVDQLDVVRQRRAQWLPGLPGRRHMPRFVPALGVAAVVVMAASLALNFYASQPRLDGLGTPSPSATPIPSLGLGIFEPVAGRIVYGSEDGIYGIEDGIWGLDPASSDPATTVQLTSERATPLGWSADGTQLLIQKGYDNLFVLHADGSETPVVEHALGLGGATISPDGSRVVYADQSASSDCEDGVLMAVDADGGPAELLFESARNKKIQHPTFSPDGTQIAFTDGNCDSDHIVWVMNADGTGAHQIVTGDNDIGLGATHVQGLAWSPAGDRIALAIDCYLVVDEGPCENALYTFAPDGADIKRLVTPGFNPSPKPYWSPDGSRIVYTTGCAFWDADDLAHECTFVIRDSDADSSEVQLFNYGIPGPWHPGTPSSSVEPPVAPSPAPSPTAEPSDDAQSTVQLRRNGENIVFETRQAAIGPDLAAQDPETGEVRKIVQTDGIIDCRNLFTCTNFVKVAEWSSDDRWVAFEVSFGSLDGLPHGPCGPTAGVWVQDALGDPRQLTTPCAATPGAEYIEELWKWSPVGARLAFARVDGETDELFVVDPSDGRLTSLATAADLTALEWSPDGTRIAYADGGSIYEVGVDGAERSLLADSFVDVVDIAWSPNGTQILVHDQGRYRMQVMNADGSDIHLLLEGQDACCETEWSPDGDRIVYQLSIDQGNQFPWDSEVWTVAPDGSNRIKVFDSNGCAMGGTQGDALPVWAPNGTQVAYYDCGRWVAGNADGTGETEPITHLVHSSWGGGGLSGWDLAF